MVFNTNRKAELPSDWALRRIRVLRRDSYACQHRDRPGGPKCLAPANQCDHIERGMNHSLENLQALCREHHAQKTAREALEAKMARRRVDPEPHPGLLG